MRHLWIGLLLATVSIGAFSCSGSENRAGGLDAKKPEANDDKKVSDEKSGIFRIPQDLGQYDGLLSKKIDRIYMSGNNLVVLTALGASTTADGKTFKNSQWKLPSKFGSYSHGEYVYRLRDSISEYFQVYHPETHDFSESLVIHGNDGTVEVREVPGDSHGFIKFGVSEFSPDLFCLWHYSKKLVCSHDQFKTQFSVGLPKFESGEYYYPLAKLSGAPQLLSPKGVYTFEEQSGSWVFTAGSFQMANSAFPIQIANGNYLAFEYSGGRNIWKLYDPDFQLISVVHLSKEVFVSNGILSSFAFKNRIYVVTAPRDLQPQQVIYTENGGKDWILEDGITDAVLNKSGDLFRAGYYGLSTQTPSDEEVSLLEQSKALGFQFTGNFAVDGNDRLVGSVSDCLEPEGTHCPYFKWQVSADSGAHARGLQLPFDQHFISLVSDGHGAFIAATDKTAYRLNPDGIVKSFDSNDLDIKDLKMSTDGKPMLLTPTGLYFANANNTFSKISYPQDRFLDRVSRFLPQKEAAILFWGSAVMHFSWTTGELTQIAQFRDPTLDWQVFDALDDGANVVVLGKSLRNDSSPIEAYLSRDAGISWTALQAPARNVLDSKSRIYKVGHELFVSTDQELLAVDLTNAKFKSACHAAENKPWRCSTSRIVGLQSNGNVAHFIRYLKSQSYGPPIAAGQLYRVKNF